MKKFILEFDKQAIQIQASELPPPVISYSVDDKCWYLEAEYSYQDGENLVKVPKGFDFDLASIPRFLWWLIAPFELSITAPLLHDFVYVYRGDLPEASIVPVRIYNRKEADGLFKRIMKQEGVSKWRITAAYFAVRLFGKRAWLT